MYWWMILDSRDNYDWDDFRHSVDQVALFWAKDEKEAKAMAKKWGFHEFDMAGRYKTIKDAKKSWKSNQKGNPPHKYNEIDFAVKDGKMMKGNQMNEAYKVHYPSLKKLTQLQYTDPRVNTEGKKIHMEKEGNFRHGDNDCNGHYVVYEDEAMPGSYIGVHIGSDINEESGEVPVNVVAIDPSRSAVVNRVAYRMRKSRVAEADIPNELTEGQRMLKAAGILTESEQLDEGLGDAIKSVKNALENIFTNRKETEEANKATFDKFVKELDAFMKSQAYKKYAGDRRKIDREVSKIKKSVASGNWKAAKGQAEMLRKTFNRMGNMKSVGTDPHDDGKW